MAVTSLQKREMIAAMVQQGMKDGRIAEVLGMKARTVRKWRRKWQKQGWDGLASTMGRPKRGAMSSFEKKITQQIDQWREQYSGWGPKTLWSGVN
jgi:transposase